MITESDKLAFFKGLYEDAKGKSTAIREKLREYVEQYKGSRLFGASNPGAAPADVVRNITYELIESQVDTSIPPSRVDAERWSEKNGRNAKSIERLCNNLRNKLPVEEYNDLDERYTYVFGGSVWTVEWDESIRSHEEVGGIALRIHNPQFFCAEPGIYSTDDMEYCFFEYTSTVEDVERKYGVSLRGDTAQVNIDENENVVVVVCFYRNEDDNVSQYIYSGDTELMHVEDFFARKRYICAECGRRKELCESDKHCDCGGEFIAENEEYEELTHDIKLSDGRVIPAMSPVVHNGVREKEEYEVPAYADSGIPLFDADEAGNMIPRMQKKSRTKMAPTRIRWYKPKSLPVVIRRNTSQIDTDDKDATKGAGIAPNMQFLGQSDCEYIKYQQWEVNKLESRIHQKLMRASVMPYMPDDATVTRGNGVFDEAIRLKAGESPAYYGTIDTTPNIALDLNQSERMYDQARKTLGITASYQGQADSTAQSGKAKQVQVAQSAGRLTSKRVLKNAAWARFDRIVFEYFLAYADEPRPIAYKDEWGRMHNATFNRYDFLEYDDYTGEWYYDDRYLFSVDASANVVGDRAQMWQLNQQNFSAGTFGNPQELTTIIKYWQAQEQAHYPGARAQVEYFQGKYQEQLAMREQMARTPAAMPQGQMPQAGQGAPTQINNVVAPGAAIGG